MKRAIKPAEMKSPKPSTEGPVEETTEGTSHATTREKKDQENGRTANATKRPAQRRAATPTFPAPSTSRLSPASSRGSPRGRLPLELVQIIVDELYTQGARGTLAALAATSGPMHALVLPVLWRRIVLTRVNAERVLGLPGRWGSRRRRARHSANSLAGTSISNASSLPNAVIGSASGATKTDEASGSANRKRKGGLNGTTKWISGLPEPTPPPTATTSTATHTATTAPSEEDYDPRLPRWHDPLASNVGAHLAKLEAEHVYSQRFALPVDLAPTGTETDDDRYVPVSRRPIARKPPGMAYTTDLVLVQWPQKALVRAVCRLNGVVFPNARTLAIGARTVARCPKLFEAWEEGEVGEQDERSESGEASESDEYSESLRAREPTGDSGISEDERAADDGRGEEPTLSAFFTRLARADDVCIAMPSTEAASTTGRMEWVLGCLMREDYAPASVTVHMVQKPLGGRPEPKLEDVFRLAGAFGWFPRREPLMEDAERPEAGEMPVRGEPWRTEPVGDGDGGNGGGKQSAEGSNSTEATASLTILYPPPLDAPHTLESASLNPVRIAKADIDDWVRATSPSPGRSVRLNVRRYPLPSATLEAANAEQLRNANRASALDYANPSATILNPPAPWATADADSGPSSPDDGGGGGGGGIGFLLDRIRAEKAGANQWTDTWSEDVGSWAFTPSDSDPALLAALERACAYASILTRRASRLKRSLNSAQDNAVTISDATKALEAAHAALKAATAALDSYDGKSRPELARLRDERHAAAVGVGQASRQLKAAKAEADRHRILRQHDAGLKHVLEELHAAEDAAERARDEFERDRRERRRRRLQGLEGVEGKEPPGGRVRWGWAGCGVCGCEMGRRGLREIVEDAWRGPS